MKSTMAVINGKEIPMFKSPKTDNGTKVSQKGCVVVFPDGSYKDGYKLKDACQSPGNQLQPVFRDGNLLQETSLSQIRKRLTEDRYRNPYSE